MTRIFRLLNIKPAEQDAVIALSLYYFLITATYVLGMAATPAIFFGKLGDVAKDYYPLLTTINTLVVAILVPTFNHLAKRLPLNALVVASNLFFVVFYIVLEIGLQITPWASAVMVAVTLSGFTIGQLQYYLIAGTIFDARQSKRILGLIGIGGGVAGIISGLAVKPIIQTISGLLGNAEFGAQSIISLVIILTSVTAFIVYRTRPYMKDNKVNEPDNTAISARQKQPDQPIFDRYLIMLMVIIGSFILVATLADFQYRIVLADTYPIDTDQAAFHGRYVAITGGIQMLLRFFVVGPVLVNFGVLAGLLALPVAMIGVSSVLLTQVNVWTATLVKGTDQSLRYTLNETAVELGWIPVPIQQRLVAKPFISGVFIAVIQGLTGILVFAMNQSGFGSVRLLSFIVLGICAIWIPATIALKRGYLNKLMDSIRQRQVDFKDLDINTADSAIVKTIETNLRNGTDLERAFVLELIEDVHITPWSQVLAEVFKSTENITVKERILMLAAHHPDIISDQTLLDLIEQPNDLSDEAIIAAGERGMYGIMPLLRQRLQSEIPVVRAASARAILRLAHDEIQSAMSILQNMLQSDDESSILAALYIIRELPVEQANNIAAPAILRDLLRYPAPVQMRVLDIIAHTKSPLLGNVVELLANPITEQKARNVLTLYHYDDVQKLLLRLYQSDTTPLRLRVAISRALNDYLSTDLADIMIASLDVNNRAMYNEAVDTLLVISRAGMLLNHHLVKLEGHGLNLARKMFGLHIALASVKQQPAEMLFIELLETDIQDAVPTLLKLAVMDAPETDIDSVILYLQRPNTHSMGNVLELLDNVLSSSERSVIIPLFESLPTEKLIEIGQKQFPDLNVDIDDELSYYINYGDDWQVSVALDYTLRHPELDIETPYTGTSISERSLPLLARSVTSAHADTPLYRANGQDINMYSILEKTVLLKNSSLFSEIKARDLYHIAQITDDVKIASGETLFTEDDLADAMYIIASGEIRIHLAEQTLAVLGSGSPIGEIALLDQQPRTASATATQDSYLLRIMGVDFFETISVYADINRSIMRLLAGRLRMVLKTSEQDRIQNQ